MVFPGVMHNCESWTIKKAERQAIYVFKLWHWRGFLRVPWTARRSNQSVLSEINPEYSMEVLMLKLKLQYFGHLMWTTDSSEKSLMLGKSFCRQEKRASEDEFPWMTSPMQWTWTWANFQRQWRTERPAVLHSIWLQRVRHDWVTKQVSF